MISQPTILIAAVLGLCATAPQPAANPAPAEERHVDLAICLDTSGSMKGLIDAARQNIWAIVNDLALAKPTPKLRIALLTFGNTGHKEEDGWVAVQTPLTDDLDLVSQKLFALTTNGGDEYVGRVLQASLDKLEWTTQKDALKLIVVAGNEGADQDKEVDFRAMCKRSISQGIMVNSIYCGNAADQLAPVWREVATRADGQFAAIDKDNGTVVIETPFDAQLQALSADINKTYIPYGKQGEWGAANQVEQDKNAQGLNGAAAAQRAMTKSRTVYCNSSWDLIDACKAKDFKLAEVKAEDLPENMRKMSVKERTAYVEKLTKQRADVQKTIADVNTKREAWVAEEMKRRALDTSKSFDFAVRSAVRAQAKAKGIQMQ